MACALAETEHEGGVSPRVSPLAHVRDCGSLLGRANLTLPAVDVDIVTVGYASPDELVEHLRAMAETNAGLMRRHLLPRATARAASATYSQKFPAPDAASPRRRRSHVRDPVHDRLASSFESADGQAARHRHGVPERLAKAPRRRRVTLDARRAARDGARLVTRTSKQSAQPAATPSRSKSRRGPASGRRGCRARRPARPHTTTPRVVAIRERAHERVGRRTIPRASTSLARARGAPRARADERASTDVESIAGRGKPARSEDDERDRRRARDGRRGRRGADDGLVERFF